MGPVQVIAPGFLGFLQLKTNGRNPVEMSEVFAPVVEMKDWLLEANVQYLAVTTAALAAGTIGSVAFTVPITVPPDQAWWVKNFSILGPPQIATDTTQFQVMWRNQAAAPSSPHLEGAPSPLLTGVAATRANQCFAKDFWLPPGSELLMRVMAMETATSLTLTAALRYVAMPT